MVLADTSVWLDHWRHGNQRLATLLNEGGVVVHPFVLGEIALGTVTPRAEVLQRLSKLAVPRVAQHDEMLALIDRTPLWGRGVGWVDAHLLASALLDRLRLWTLDRRVAAVARDLGIALPA
ncbi:MAG TPA: PIN domain-containing protein [Methylomirabilota bacterium]